MRDKTRVYAAGILDSEGCVSINKCSGSRGANYSARIVVANKSRQLTKWLVRHFGGYVSVAPPKRATHGACYFWHLSSAVHTRRFLSEVRPFLRLKRVQADLLLDYLNLNGKSDTESREEMYRQSRELKHEVRVTTETPTSSKLDFAYLAGFFDGEGTASIISFVGHGYRQHAARVYVTNTDLPILEFYRTLFGGTIREHQRPNKLCYRWELRKNEEREKFLLYVLPYLIVKKTECNLVLQFLRLGKTEDPAARAQLYRQLRRFKHERMIQSRLCGNVQDNDSENCRS